MNTTQINIGEAAKHSGVSAKMIRHYEGIGLIQKATRTYSGYRTYAASDVHTLRFIRQARNVGFSLKQIEELLGLWRNQHRPSSKVKALAQEHIAGLEARIAELEAMKHTLASLAKHCHGDDRPECPILEGLAALSTGGAIGLARKAASSAKH
jgi:Cu(I)-responsive transcriptional regulator